MGLCASANEKVYLWVFLSWSTPKNIASVGLSTGDLQLEGVVRSLACYLQVSSAVVLVSERLGETAHSRSREVRTFAEGSRS